MKQEFKARIVKTNPIGVRMEAISTHIIRSAELCQFDQVFGSVQKNTYMIIICKLDKDAFYPEGKYLPVAHIDHRTIAEQNTSVHELTTYGGTIIAGGEHIEIEIIKEQSHGKSE